MKAPIYRPLLIWSIRELGRRPLQSLLLALAVMLCSLLIGLPLLLSQALSHTSALVLSQAPDLVVRRVSSIGWRPMPEQTALAAASNLTGVTRAAGRVWGYARSPWQALTVWGAPGTPGRQGQSMQLPRMPQRGEAIIGPGVSVPDGTRLPIEGQAALTLRIAGRLPPEAGLQAHDLVIVHRDDARRVLGLAPGWVSDLTIDVFHAPEAGALAADLAAALPWPVQVSTRTDTLGALQAALARRTTMGLSLYMPALLALSLLAGAVIRDQMSQRWEVGLLKALGWTTSDCVRLKLYSALCMCVPATAVGLALAGGLVFWPGINWPVRLLFGWSTLPPSLYLRGGQFGLVILQVAVFVPLPFLLATLWPALKAAAADPQELLEGELV